jgi:type IV secretory pathway VirB4 component
MNTSTRRAMTGERTKLDRRPPRVRVAGKARLLRLGRQQMTTAQCCSLYPFQTESGLGPRGVLVGTTWPSGALFFYDPFALYQDGALDNPNVMVFGEPGSGKSAAVKCLVARHVGLLGARGVGRQAFVVDPKREYDGLAEALSMTRLELRPGGRHAMNPLGSVPGSNETSAERLVRRHRLMAALLASLLGHGLDRSEDAVLGWALETLGARERERPSTSPTSLIDLATVLESPSEEMAERGSTTTRELAELCRPLWLLVDKLVRRDLAGMFDGTEPLSGAVLSPTGVVLDVSAVFSDKALLRLVMIAAIAVLQACYLEGDASDEWSMPRRFLVVDECWSLLSQEESARFLQENWKLARARGVANVAVCHRVTDLSAQADSDKATSKIGDGLIADTQTHIVFRTSAHALEETRRSLGLSDPETETLPRLPRATALWKVRGQSTFVRHVRSAYEETFTDTDARLA